MTRPTNHQEATMFVIHTADREALAVVADATTDESGVWCWMGHFQGATLETLQVGTTLENWYMFDGPLDFRTDWECVKVNRVTAKFTDAWGHIVTLRIDR